MQLKSLSFIVGINMLGNYNVACCRDKIPRRHSYKKNRFICDTVHKMKSIHMKKKDIWWYVKLS